MKTSSPSATKKSSKAKPASEMALLPTPAPAASGARILLADDDPGVRESLAAALRSDGYLVLPAKDGQEALNLASINKVDLVLLDLNMPVKNGWDAFERLTAENPLLPIIIVTARPNQLFTAINAGVGALLEKPLDISVLLKTIQRLLREPAEERLRRFTGQTAPFYFQPSPEDMRAGKEQPDE
jgi:DNA-binding response OmpR family regulator